jgi:beta-lactamase regulating signal transducer with metallopeptidase domain
MLNALAWNLLLTAVLAILLATMCRLSWLARRPALRHWLWLLLLAKLVTPPLVAVPLLPAAATAMPVGQAHRDESVLDSRLAASSHDAAKAKSLAANNREPAVERQEPNVAGQAANRPGQISDLPHSREISSPGRDSIASPGPRLPSQTLLLAGLLAVSLFGTCVILMVHAFNAMKLHKWLNRAARESRLLTESCDEVAARFAVRSTVRCCVVETRTTPLLWGWRRPLVVMPRELMDGLSPRELRGIVAHELAHFLRHDHWANAFALLVKSLMWWNPVVWWADVELRAAQELCCDAIAIDCCNADRRGYATTLLKALDFIQVVPLAPRALAAGMGSKRTILRRFEMLGERRICYRLSRCAFVALFVAAIASICMPVRGKEQPREAAPAPVVSNAGATVVVAASGDKKEAKAAKKSAKAGRTVTAGSEGERVLGPRPQGKCSLSGKVVSEKTGKPLAGARMYLHYGVTHGCIFVNTAEDGTFSIKDIPVGPYSFCMSHTPGYRKCAYNPDNKPDSWPPFSLKDGEQRGGIVLNAKQACQVRGKIVGENGKAPENVDTLTVLAWFRSDDDKKTYLCEQTRVNRRDGTYLMDGLSDKPVYIMAIDWRAAKEGNACPPIYYPGVFSRNEAKLISFDKSSKVEGIDIALRKKGGLVLEGTVRDDTGKPVPEAFVVVDRRDMLFDFNTVYTDEQGHYEIQGLGEGEFCVHVDAVHRGLVRTRALLDLGKSKPKTQRDFALVRGATISGKLVDENGKEWQIGESYGDACVEPPEEIKEDRHNASCYSLTQFWNKHRNNHDLTRGMGGSFSLGDGDYYSNADMFFPTGSTFTIEAIKPGHTTLCFLPNKEKQKVLKILYDGKDVTKSGIDTKPGEEIKDVKIVIGPAEKK